MLTMKQRLEWIVLHILFVFPIKKNRISFLCYNCTQYSCNPKYISEYINSNFSGEYELVWYFTDETVLKLMPDYVIKYKKNSFKYFLSLMTSSVVISNVTLPRVIPFRKKQLRINTWHGTAFKGDSNKTGNNYNRFDVFLAENELTCEVLKRTDSFDYRNDISKIGMPRNDLLVRNGADTRLNIKTKLGIQPDENIILYAPTYREGIDDAPFNIDFQKLQECLSQRFGGKWKVLFRYHHMQQGRVVLHGSKDVTSFPDMQELLLAADILITDYSSTMWDFSLMSKLVILYAEDLDHYITKERGDFFYPYSKLPFPMARNNQEMCEAIANFDSNEYEENLKAYHEALGRFNYDGNATKRFVDKFIVHS